MLRLKEYYNKEIKSKLKSEFSIKNDLAIPVISKIVLNVGMGKTREDKNFLIQSSNTLSVISGQKPVPCLAKKSISGFKVRQGEIVGLKITLRGARMYDFLEKLTRIVLPRTRDFRGLKPSSIDRQGNLSIGLKEIFVFPEITTEKMEKNISLEVSIISTASNKKMAVRFFELLGFPIQLNEK